MLELILVILTGVLGIGYALLPYMGSPTSPKQDQNPHQDETEQSIEEEIQQLRDS